MSLWTDDIASGVFSVAAGSVVTANVHLAPTTDATYDLGTSSLAWRVLYADDIRMNGGSGSDLLWTTDGAGDIGAASDTRPANIYATTLISSAGTMTLTAGSGAHLTWGTDGAGNIGAAADNRPASIYASSLVSSAGTITLTHATTAHLTWGTDGGGNIGAAADNRPANIYASALVSSAADITATGVSGQIALTGAKAISTTPSEAKSVVLRNTTAAANGAQQYSPSLYLASQGWETTGGSSDEVITRIESQAVQGTAAGCNLVISQNTDGGAFSRRFRIGSEIYTDVAIYPNTTNAVPCGAQTAQWTNVVGRIVTQGGANGQAAAWKHLSEELTIAAAASSTTAIEIPAGAIAAAVSVRVTTVIPDAATFDVGVGGATTRYATGISVAANTTDKGTLDGLRYYAAGTPIVITPNTPPLSNTGRVRVSIHYLEVTAPTS